MIPDIKIHREYQLYKFLNQTIALYHMQNCNDVVTDTDNHIHTRGKVYHPIVSHLCYHSYECGAGVDQYV
jgi:hypothetical protein